MSAGSINCCPVHPDAECFDGGQKGMWTCPSCAAQNPALIAHLVSLSPEVQEMRKEIRDAWLAAGNPTRADGRTLANLVWDLYNQSVGWTISRALDVVTTMNDRLPDGSHIQLEVRSNGWYTCILLGDICLWDDEDNQPRCQACDVEDYDPHVCPGDTVAGIIEHVETQLREYIGIIWPLARLPKEEQELGYGNKGNGS